MTPFLDIFLVVLKLGLAYVVGNIVIWGGGTMDYAVLVSTIFYFWLILWQIKGISSLVTTFIFGIILISIITGVISQFTYSSFYFWVFGWENAFLFS